MCVCLCFSSVLLGLDSFICWCIFFWFFFFKQKTAYEMRISDWSSDVCSSDLTGGRLSGDGGVAGLSQILAAAAQGGAARTQPGGTGAAAAIAAPAASGDAGGGRPADGARPHRPRRVRPRKARGRSEEPRLNSSH